MEVSVWYMEVYDIYSIWSVWSVCYMEVYGTYSMGCILYVGVCMVL